MRFLKPGMFLRNLKCASETWNVFWKPGMFLPNLNVFPKPGLFFFFTYNVFSKPGLFLRNLNVFLKPEMCFRNQEFFCKTWNVLSKPKMCFQNLQCFAKPWVWLRKHLELTFLYPFQIQHTLLYSLLVTMNFVRIAFIFKTFPDEETQFKS